jgi:hypothetical protein
MLSNMFVLHQKARQGVVLELVVLVFVIFLHLP